MVLASRLRQDFFFFTYVLSRVAPLESFADLLLPSFSPERVSRLPFPSSSFYALRAASPPLFCSLFPFFCPPVPFLVLFRAVFVLFRALMRSLVLFSAVW